MARPHKFTQENVSLILVGIKNGLSYKTACECAGVSYETFNEWKRGQFPRGTKFQPIPSERKAQFSEGLTRARARGVSRLHDRIAKAGRKDWRADAWLLERIEPDTYAKNRLELTGRDGGPIELTDLIDNRINKIAERFGMTPEAVRAMLAGAKAGDPDE